MIYEATHNDTRSAGGCLSPSTLLSGAIVDVFVTPNTKYSLCSLSTAWVMEMINSWAESLAGHMPACEGLCVSLLAWTLP